MIGFACGMAVSVLILATAWFVMHDRSARVVESRVRERVVVTLKSGDSFAGVLFAHDPKALVLRETEALGAGERRTNVTLDGELIVLMPDVLYIQKV